MLDLTMPGQGSALYLLKGSGGRTPVVISAQKEKRIKSRDPNTRYFHLLTFARKRKNQISYIN